MHQIFLLSLLINGAVTPSQYIDVKEIGEGRYEFTLTADAAMEVAEAQHLLWSQVVETCDGAEAQYGRYRFDSKTPIGDGADTATKPIFKFVQEVSCGSSAAPDPLVRDTIGIYREDSTQELNSFISRISTDYMAKRSQGAIDEAYAALSQDMRSYSTFDEWAKQVKMFNEMAGKLTATRIWRVTVYDNPLGAPEPGTYIAADYENEFENVPLQCGYLIWYRLPDEHYTITREETGVITNEIIAQISPNQLVQVKQQFRCAPPQ